MLPSLVNQFNFYTDYLWAPGDFANLQTWLQSEFRGIALGFAGNKQAVLQGCQVTPDGALNIEISAGVAIDTFGRITLVQAANSVPVVSPVGNPAKTLVVLRPKLVDLNDIPLPDDPLTSVPLYEGLDYDLVVLNGTPSATPVYPSTMANDIIVAGLELPAAVGTITQAMFDFTVISSQVSGRRALGLMDSSGAVLNTDGHVDLDATSGSVTATLPLAYTVPGQEFTFCKIDNINPATVAAQGSDMISGQASWELSDQWATLRVLSVGTGYRILN